jgi:hypothetical protein
MNESATVVSRRLCWDEDFKRTAAKPMEHEMKMEAENTNR